MKVLMIGSHLSTTGGITRVIKNYLEAGLDKEVNLTFLPTYYGKNHFLNIVYFICQYYKLASSLISKKQVYDIAHIHMSYKGSFIRKRKIIQLLNKKNIPIILHMHGSEFKEYYNSSSRKNKSRITNTLNSVNTILALGQEWKEFYSTICKTKVESLDNAVFSKPIHTVNQEKIYITSMGVLSKRKGTYDLIQVASKLDGLIDKKYKFVLAGDGDIEQVKKKVLELGLQHLFVIPGWVSDQKKIEDIYRKSLIYILPSYNEGMPMSILEAMSYGIPIISTDVGSISSVVKEENGFITKPGAVDELAEKILLVINNDIVRENMSVNNRIKISESYDIKQSIKKLISIYKENIKQSGSDKKL